MNNDKDETINPKLLAKLNDLIEVRLKDEDSFLKVKETLTRIGVAPRNQKALYQSAHILHKRGKYYIVHFKEMYSLDGRLTNFDDSDKMRRNRIAKLLEEWGLLTIVDPKKIEENLAPMNQIKVVRFEDKDEWKLVPKYNIGKKKTT